MADRQEARKQSKRSSRRDELIRKIQDPKTTPADRAEAEQDLTEAALADCISNPTED
jgi:hypothetical protein